MANSKQAKKRIRIGERNRQANVAKRSRLRTHLKKVSAAISAGDRQAAEAAYKEALPVIDRAARKGLIHMNKAARHKSRFNTHIRALPQP